MRGTPGFIHDFQPPRDHPNRPSNKFNRSQPNQTTESTWTPIQINLSEEAEAQRPLLINRTMPEPHEELLDTEEWDTFYDDRIPEDQKRIMKDLLFEVQRIKGRNASTSKHYYRDTRGSIIEAAAAAYERHRNSPQIPDYLIPVQTPWLSGGGHARLAYDQHIIEQYISQPRGANTDYKCHAMSNGNLLSTKAWACWSRRVLSTTTQFHRSITRPNIHSTFQSILQSIK